MDTVKERAEAQLQISPKDEEVMEAVKEIELRHESLAATTKKNIEELEWLTDNLNVHQELTTSHSDWQKDMWEKLHSYTGMVLIIRYNLILYFTVFLLFILIITIFFERLFW